jgi:DNA gyrase/topoisomerase IV subunit A
MERFQFSDIQAKSILEMRLSKLTGLERDKIIAEYKETMALIADLQDILEKAHRGHGKVVFDSDPEKLLDKVTALIAQDEEGLED